MFKTGDVVRLSGQPMKMTVNNVTGTSVECVWFDRDDELNTHWFRENALERAE